VLATFYSYGSVTTHRQDEMIRNLGAVQEQMEPTPEMVMAMARQIVLGGGRGV